MSSEFSQAEGIAWLVMLCVATLSWLLFSLVLLHFRTLLRSLDLILAGLMVRNIFYALVAAPVLVSVALSQSAWTLATCRLLVFSLHMPLLVSMVGTAFFAVDRLFLLRKDGGPIYNGWVTNKVKPLLLLSICCCAAFITGLVPVNLWARVTSVPTGATTGATGTADEQNRCRFLPSQLDYSYSMVLLACNLASAVFCAVCCFDGWLFLQHQRRTALAVAATAARDGTPADSVATLENGSGSLKSQQQQQQPEQQLRRSAEFDAHKHSWESWRVTSLANAIIFFCNHLPLLILDFASLVALRDGSGTEYITMLLVESILLPNSLWIFAVRYRHVVKRYFAKVTRQPNLLDDRYCAMQMFQKRCTLMGSMYRGHRARSLASTYFDSSTMDRHGQLQNSSNGRLARIHEIGHVTMGLGAASTGGVDNPVYSPTRYQLDSSSMASSFVNTDRLTHSTGSTGTEWDAVQLHQLPVSAGEQVRAVVHPLGTLPERSLEEEALDDAAASLEVDDENRIDAVIVSTADEIETTAIESPIVSKVYPHAAAAQPKSRISSSNSSSSLGDNLHGNAFYLTEADLQEIARQRQLEDDAVKDYRRPRRQPNELESVQFPRMYVNPLMRSVSGFSDDFSSAAKNTATAAAAAASSVNSSEQTTESNDQGNNFSQELDSYL